MTQFKPAWLMALVFGLVAALEVVHAQSRLSDADLAKAIAGGGYVFVMRHAAADPDSADTDPLNFKNIKRQQLLTDAGKAAARGFGAAMKTMGVTFGEVVTSRFHRAVQTAVLAGYENAKPLTALTEGSLVVSPNENRRRATTLRQLIGQPLPFRQNRLIVSHRANIGQALGKEWYDTKEGEASIFKVEGGAYTLVARIQIDEWSRIAAAVKR